MLAPADRRAHRAGHRRSTRRSSHGVRRPRPARAGARQPRRQRARRDARRRQAHDPDRATSSSTRTSRRPSRRRGRAARDALGQRHRHGHGRRDARAACSSRSSPRSRSGRAPASGSRPSTASSSRAAAASGSTASPGRHDVQGLSARRGGPLRSAGQQDAGRRAVRAGSETDPHRRGRGEPARPDDADARAARLHGDRRRHRGARDRARGRTAGGVRPSPHRPRHAPDERVGARGTRLGTKSRRCGSSFMSGYANEVLPGAALKHGAAFLEKPFSGNDLAQKVRQTLDDRRAPALVA